MAKVKKINLAGWILIAMILGVICGLLFLGNPEFTTDYIKPFGTIFVNLLKFIAVPIVLLSLICGIISMGDYKKVGSIGWKTVVYYLITTFIATVIGLGVGLYAKNYFPVLDTSGVEYTVESASFTEMIVNIFPSNMWAAFQNASMMQIIVIAVFIGIAILVVGKAADPFAKVIQSANTVFGKIVMFIIKASPVGVFCLMCSTVAVNGTQIIGSLAAYIGFTYLAYILHMLVVYATSIKVLAKGNPFEFFKIILPAMVFAFTSSSSLATLPLTTNCANKAGANPEYSSFVLPLGASINMDGSSIVFGITVIFIATCYGIDLNLAALITVSISVTLASIGIAGVPGTGVLLAMILQSVGLPVEGIALILGVMRLVDMGCTTVNIVGDAVAALVITRIQDGKLNS